MCCRRRAVVRLGRKRSNELYAKFTSFAQGSEDWHVYANDTVGFLSLHDAHVSPDLLSIFYAS